MTLRAIDDADFIHKRRLELELERRKVGGDCGCFLANTAEGLRLDPGCCVRHRPDAPGVAANAIDAHCAMAMPVVHVVENEWHAMRALNGWPPGRVLP